jgi:hypothetical protein
VIFRVDCQLSPLFSVELAKLKVIPWPVAAEADTSGVMDV